MVLYKHDAHQQLTAKPAQHHPSQARRGERAPTQKTFFYCMFARGSGGGKQLLHNKPQPLPRHPSAQSTIPQGQVTSALVAVSLASPLPSLSASDSQRHTAPTTSHLYSPRETPPTTWPGSDSSLGLWFLSYF